MDSIFHKVKGNMGWFTVVKVAKEEPHRYGKKGELLIEYTETEEAVRRRSSVHRATSYNDAEKARDSMGRLSSDKSS